MAAGDTIAGQIRIFKTVRLGHSNVVAGPFRSVEADSAWANDIILNPDEERHYASGQKLVPAPKAIFQEGEIIEVQVNAAALAEAGTYDSDSFSIDCIEEDLNTDDIRMRTLNVADQELVADFTTIVGVWVTIFQYTVPTRQKLTLSGVFSSEAEETA